MAEETKVLDRLMAAVGNTEEKKDYGRIICIGDSKGDGSTTMIQALQKMAGDLSGVSLPGLMSFRSEAKYKFGHLRLVDEKHEQELSTLIHYFTENAVSPVWPESDIFGPPKTLDDWQKTIGVILINLDEAWKVLQSLQSKRKTMQEFIGSMIQEATTSEDREQLQSKIKPNPFIAQWRAELGLESLSQDAEIPFDPSIPVPLYVVVTKADYFRNEMRLDEYDGQCEIIEAALMKECLDIGATLIFLEPLQDPSRAITPLDLYGVLYNNICRDLHLPYTLYCPKMPQCMEPKDIVEPTWIPCGLYSENEIASLPMSKNLATTPFSVLVTFSKVDINVSKGTLELPPKTTSEDLFEFYKNLATQLQLKEVMEITDPSYTGVPVAGKATKGASGEQNNVKSFFGGLINKTDASPRRTTRATKEGGKEETVPTSKSVTEDKPPKTREGRSKEVDTTTNNNADEGAPKSALKSSLKSSLN